MIAIHAGDATQIELLIMRKKQRRGPRPCVAKVKVPNESRKDRM
jgi:hypothetical protein